MRLVLNSFRLLFLLLSPILIADFQLRQSNPFIIGISLFVFACAYGLVVSFLFNSRSRLAVFTAVTAFTLVWGDRIFRSYVYYDELGRQRQTTLIGDLSSWFVPINDHIQPVMMPIWWIQYHEFFGGSYVPISIFLYTTAVVGICAIFYICRELSLGLGYRSALIIALISSVPLHNPDLWFWKPAGDGQVLSLTCLALWICLLIRSKGNLKFLQFLSAALLIVMTVFSSSMLTLIFIYALPLLLIRQLRTLSICLSITFAALVSSLFWIVRFFLADVGISNYSPDPWEIPGALLGVWIQFGYENIALVGVFTFVALVGIVGILQSDPAIKSLMIFALLCLLIGSIQLWAARDLTLWSSRGFTGYQFYLPFFGCSILFALGLPPLLRKLGMESISLKLVVTSIFGLALLSIVSPIRSDYFSQGIPVADTLSAREEFFSDLRSLGSKSIPDYSMATSVKANVLHFAPAELLAPLESGGWQTWHDIVRLSSLRKLSDGDFTPVSCNVKVDFLAPEVQFFISKYWDSPPGCQS